MKRGLRLVIGVMMVLLLDSKLGSTNQKDSTPREAARVWGNRYSAIEVHRAIEVHQGGQDGGGALW